MTVTNICEANVSDHNGKESAMNGFLKFALGVAVLGVVGLVGLSVMSIVATLVFSPSTNHHVVPGEEAPARTAEVQEIEHATYRTFNDSAEPARVGNVDVAYPVASYAVAHTVRDSFGVPSVFVSIFFAFVVLIVLAGAFVLLLRITRAKHSSATPDETALVHELARRAQDLSLRMEALETILLDRTRTAR